MSNTTTLEKHTFYYQVIPKENIVYLDTQLYATLYSAKNALKLQDIIILMQIKI